MHRNGALLIGILGLAAFLWGCRDSGLVTVPNPNGSVEGVCTGGVSDRLYACNGIDLLARMSAGRLQGEKLNDIWGWTDPRSGKEYALAGLTDGVAFVDLSNPADPLLVGRLPESAAFTRQSQAGDSRREARPAVMEGAGEAKSTWRDFKTYGHYLYVVSDGQPQGMQIFDLDRLREVADPPALFEPDAHYDGFGAAHNIAINEESGFAYAVGTGTYGGGLHIVDIRDPLQPRFAGFHSDSSTGIQNTGYVHDTQCVTYRGPDADYTGDEICFSSGETHLVIANVTEKDSTRTISAAGYPGIGYMHQGWLTEDHRFFLSDDEMDESRYGHNTRTYIWDLSDLDNPVMTGYHEADGGSADHNQYVKGNRAYQANYTAGLRILDISGIESGNLSEVAWFDTFPFDDELKFDGAWSTYPYFESGIIVVSDMTNGLFILKPHVD